MTSLAVFLVIVAASALLVWLGLQVRPASFPPDARVAPTPGTVPIPAGLPAPVDRYLRTVYGSDLPVIDTVLIKGRAVIRPFMNIPLQAQFVFVHRAGRDYRHYFEATFFGLPLLKVNEGYIDGHSFFESPMGNLHDDPNSNQGANLALWAEAVWFPSLWVTDSRVSWQAVDDHTAILRVPFGSESERFVVRFDPQSHLLTTMEAMRYRERGPGQAEDPLDHPERAWHIRAWHTPECIGIRHVDGSGSPVGRLHR